VGWAPQRPALYGRLTTRENLELFASLERRDDPVAVARDLIEHADLGDFADVPARSLSTGTLQRLNLCVALAGAPAVLLLDEPTATLSPDQRIRLWDWLEGLRAEHGLAILFSTQSVDEASRHSSRLLILAGGRVAFSGTAGELAQAGGGEDVAAAERAFLTLTAGPER
jgi:ABC-2 type transport system ATP-binding protein